MTESFHPDIRGTRASGATRFRIVHPYWSKTEKTDKSLTIE